jgi:hypothetical protein
MERGFLKEIKAIIDRFEGDLAVLKLNGAEVLWPKTQLPGGMGEGDLIVFQILTDEESQKEKEQLAKDFINNLLKNDEEKKQE